MKTFAFLTLALIASVQAFVPSQQGRPSFQLKESLADKIFGLDLFAPVQDQNNYGARKKKNVSEGRIISCGYPGVLCLAADSFSSSFSLCG